MSLPISRIRIRKFMSIEELVFTPGAITVFKGKNGRGKTAALQGILSLFRGGVASMVREGETEAELGVLLRDDTTIDRRIKAEGKQPRALIKPQGGAAVGSPATWLKERVDDLINPLDFVTAAPEDRENWLLQAVPQKVTPGELLEALGPETTWAVSVDDIEKAAGEHALIAIDRISTRIFDARTEANTTARGKRASQEQLRGSLPPADDEATDWAVVENELARQLGGIDAELKAARRAADLKAANEQAAAGSDFEAARKTVVADINARIATLRTEGERRIADALAERNRRVADANTLSANENQAAEAAASANRGGLGESLGEARAKRAEAERVANTRVIIEGMESEALALEQSRAELTGALARFGALKTKLLERMPLAGIEPRNGQLYRNGIIFERLNTAQVMDIAMEVAELRAGRIGLVCVDGIERLDSENKALWYERARNSGLNFFFSEVTDDEGLIIEGAEAVEGAAVA